VSKKILITGGTGLLGVNWAYSNFKKHKIILGFNNRRVSLENCHSYKVDFKTFEKTIFTINNIKPDIIVNSIGMTNIENCETFPDIAKLSNEIIPSNIAKACNQLNIPLVHISTDHLFDGNKTLVSEDEKLKPINEYAKSKARGELKVTKQYPKAIIIRTNFFGWGTFYRQSFSDFIISNLRSKRSITLFGNVYFNPIIIEKLIENIYQLLDINERGTYNIVCNDRLSKYAFGIKIAEKFNLNMDLIKLGNIKNIQTLVLRPLDMTLSNKKISTILNKSIGTSNDQIDELFNQEKSKRNIKIFNLK
jgi:dTDP-4-dehydrorhamnose reductase